MVGKVMGGNLLRAMRAMEVCSWDAVRHDHLDVAVCAQLWRISGTRSAAALPSTYALVSELVNTTDIPDAPCRSGVPL